MTTQIQGVCVRVIVRPYEVKAFANRWPCSGFADGVGFDFIFDSRNGDLVDVQARSEAGRICAAADFDGPALAALADDAKAAAQLN